jgi:Leucine-rich repeat (LRR) protein
MSAQQQLSFDINLIDHICLTYGKNGVGLNNALVNGNPHNLCGEYTRVKILDKFANGPTFKGLKKIHILNENHEILSTTGHIKFYPQSPLLPIYLIIHGAPNINVDSIMPFVNELEIQNTKISVAPPMFPLIKKIQIHHTEITELTLSNLPNLPMVDCRNNKITKLSLSNIPNLTSLDCSNNKITTQTLSNIPNLTSLDCSNNQIAELTLADLPNLTSVNCSNNKIKHISVVNCPNLVEINLIHNELDEYPDLPSGIRKLDLNSNKINTIPDINILTKYPNLTLFSINNNPCKYLQKEYSAAMFASLMSDIEDVHTKKEQSDQIKRLLEFMETKTIEHANTKKEQSEQIKRLLNFMGTKTIEDANTKKEQKEQSEQIKRLLEFMETKTIEDANKSDQIKRLLNFMETKTIEDANTKKRIIQTNKHFLDFMETKTIEDANTKKEQKEQSYQIERLLDFMETNKHNTANIAKLCIYNILIGVSMIWLLWLCHNPLVGNK